jgi:hypothetical protein
VSALEQGADEIRARLEVGGMIGGHWDGAP